VVEPASNVDTEILAGLELAGENGVGLQGTPESNIGSSDLVSNKEATKGQVVVELLEDDIQALEVRGVDNILALVNEVIDLERGPKVLAN